MSYSLQQSELSTEETRQVYAGLMATDPPDQPRNFTSLTLTLRDANGTVAGALMGATVWNWLSIDVLWVANALRRGGYGAALVQQAEHVARDRGCTHARLDTFDFQARGFYERLGYSVYGALGDFPAGHTQYHMRKQLAL